MGVPLADVAHSTNKKKNLYMGKLRRVLMTGGRGKEILQSLPDDPVVFKVNLYLSGNPLKPRNNLRLEEHLQILSMR